jgi:hypothetical protein
MPAATPSRPKPKGRSRARAIIRLPKNLRPKPLADGSTAYFFELPPYARPRIVGKGRDKRRIPAVRHDRPCPVESQPLGTDLAVAIGKADQLNAQLEEWRVGAEPPPSLGTVAWLFAWYRTKDRFKELSAVARRDYRKSMDQLEAVKLKTTTFGALEVGKVKSDHADALYRLFLKQVGKRQAALRMQVARRCWNEWLRDHPGANPFGEMALDMKAKHGNRPTSRAEYDRFREAARKLGLQSMATAASLSFELVRRVSDVFGFVARDEEEGDPGGIYWEDYHAGETIAVVQHKTGRRQVLPLRGDPDPSSEDPEVREKGPLLYPELEAELARTPRGEPDSMVDGRKMTMIVVREPAGTEEKARGGRPRRSNRYTERVMNEQFHRVRIAAGLPDGMIPTGFRHGGATELGDAVVAAKMRDPDLRPITGHATKEMVSLYDKPTQSKARELASVRRRFVEGKARK